MASILIVDDEPKVAFFLSRALEHSNRNYRVTTAGSGEEALEFLDRSEVDLLVTDLCMPGISGLELIRQARLSNPQTRTILITAYGDEETESEADRLEISCYITKPFDIRQFTEAVQEALCPSSIERALADEQWMRDVLVSVIFHELRVPLTYILGHAGILAEKTQGQHQELAQAILRHTLHFRDALDDFTLFAEWGVAQLPGYLQQVDLQQALQVTVTDLAASLTMRHQSVELEPFPEPIVIMTDSLLLRALLTSFISGAAKGMQEGGQITIRVTREDTQILVTIKESGVKALGARAQDELGIGLTVTRKLIDAFGGELRDEGDAVLCLALPETEVLDAVSDA